jgi:hypothetical protein
MAHKSGDLDIRQFTKRGGFSANLDRATSALAARVQISWGAARKFLNLYLREITYNFFDSNVAKALRQEKEGARLPRWRGVIHLKPDASAQYQSVAAAVAARKRTCRAHLDLLYWRPEQRREPMSIDQQMWGAFMVAGLEMQTPSLWREDA